VNLRLNSPAWSSIGTAFINATTALSDWTIPQEMPILAEAAAGISGLTLLKTSEHPM
jgi:hypothetical protein